MAKNGHIAYISTDFGHKNSDRNGNIILEDPKTENVNMIDRDIGNHRS